MNQKESVYQATVAVCAENNIVVEPGFDAKISVTKPMRLLIVGLVAQSIFEGHTEIKDRSKYDTLEKIEKYTDGMVQNWFRKDTRLNGGDKYETKNPGSRAGSGDSQLKALRALREVHKTNPEAIAEIDAAIAARTAELQAEKVKQVAIDVNALPESLRKLVVAQVETAETV